MPQPAGNRDPRVSAGGQLPVECDRYIEQKLQKTRQQLHAVELAVAVLVLSVGSLAYLAAMVLVDHWIMPHGLGFGGRLAAFGVFVLAFGGYGLAYVVPLLLRRVNPLYAARAIEQSRPALKNSLINLLLLRARANELPPVVFEGMQHQAANDLTQVTVESAVDGSRLVKLGYVLAMLVVAFCLYKVLSPKDPLRSIGRVIDPWAELAVPTRVQIEDVQPGDSQQLQEKRVRVSALVDGLEPGEPVTIYYSTADGQLIDQPIRMELPDDSYRYAAELPEGGSGLQQDLSYRIVAGDAISRVYQVQALTAPAISVERVDYRYPAYTELPPRTTERQGDLQAIDGTEVTLHAKATHPIKTANVRFDDSASAGIPMSATGREASKSFPLRLKEGKPEHSTYYLVFSDRQGHGPEDITPIHYKIEVVADLPPEVAFVEPQPDAKHELSMAESGSLLLALSAEDPDFKLAKLTLEIERNGMSLSLPPLLTDPRSGPVRMAYVLNARSLGLKPGDKVVFWAVAEDNKQPDPNHTQTPKYTLRILSPQQQKKEQDQLAQAKPPEAPRPQQQPPADGQQPDQHTAGQRPQDQPPEQQPNDGQKKPQPPQQQPGEQPPGGEQKAGGGPKPDEQRVDPDADPGKAIDEINKQFGQDPKDQPPQNKPQDNQQNPDPEAGDKPSPKQKPDNPNQEESPAGNGPKSSARSQKPGDSGDGRPPDGGQAGDKGQGAPGETGRSQGDQPPAGAGDQGQNPDKPEPGGQDEKPLGAQRTGQTKPADPQAGGQPGQPDDQSGQPMPGEPMPGGQNQPGSAQPGGQGGQPQAGPQGGQPKPGQQPPSGGQPGTQPQAGQQPGSDGKGQQPQSGQPPGGQRQPGQRQPGEGQPAKGQQPGQPAPNGKQPSGQPGAQQLSEKQPGKQPGGQQPSGGKPGEQPGHDPMGGPQPGGKEQGGKPAGDQDGKQPGAKPGGDDQAGQPTGGQPGQGDKAAGKSGDQQSKDQPTKPQAGGQQAAKGGDPENEKNQAGAGQPANDKQGTPSPQDSNKSRDKQADQSGGQQQPMNSGEGSSPSRSPQDSNSKGSVGGDQSGGGEEGGGQKANQPGTGGAGQNTASDEGGGKSNEKGPGETSGKSGDQAPAKKPTPGTSGQQPGKGSGQKPGDSKPGGPQSAASGKNQPQSSPQGETPDGKPTAAAQGGGKQQGAGNPGGGGSADQYNGARSPQSASPAGPEEDPNLDYARKATDLALDRLKHQLDKPGADDLLNKLKWTREDAQRFINRWEAMKRAARQPGDAGRAAQTQLDESLRSLGLRPHGTTAAGDHYRNQRLRNLRDTARTRPPAEYADQYRAYSTGTSQVRGADQQSPPPTK